MRIRKIKVYRFDELSMEAKARAIENFRDSSADDTYWHEFVIDDAKEIGKLIGISIDNIYFSGFSSQGDGAQFEGSYAYNKNSVNLLKDYAPQDKELHRIVEALYKLQRVNFYGLTAKVEHSGHYYHKYDTSFNIYGPNTSYVKETVENALIELLRDFMDWIYKQLETEYEYVNSDEQITETIKINEYEFLETGERA